MARTVTITPRALEMFKRALQAKDKPARQDAEGELMAELKYETWEFIDVRYRHPKMRYVDDAALRGQLEQVIAKALFRPPGLG